MLNLNPVSLIFGESGYTGTATIGDFDYTPHDLTVRVMALPSHGTVTKEDGITQIHVGQMVTAAELAALRFTPVTTYSESASGPKITTTSNGFALYVAQSSEPTPIPVQALNLFKGQGADLPVTITELPSNGTVLLSDGIAVVTLGQTLHIAQLSGLMFRPAADACGQISLLQYRDCGSSVPLAAAVLLVVGPDVPSPGTREIATTGDNSSVSPIAVALLLEAGLSSVNATQASAAVSSNDLFPPDSSAPSDVTAGMAPQIFGQTTSFLPDHITAPASEILAQVMPAGDMNGSAEADTSQLRHHIGSSTPPDVGSQRLMPPSNALTSTHVPQSFEIANNAVVEIKGPSVKNVSFDTGNGELIIDHSARFHGLIGSSTPNTTLSPNDLIDLKDLPFTSGMSATVKYDSATSISTVDFSNGSKTVTLQFAGQDLNWIFKSDGQGGTIVADPPVSNAITLENQKPGTPQSVWQVDAGNDSTELEGFTTAISTNVGGTVQFKIDNLTGNPNYQVQIYRLGYYGGDGARLVTTLQHQGTSVIAQPAPITNAATGEVDAGNWSVTDSWNMPTNAVSGVYVANVVQGNQVFQIPFVVKDPNSTSDIVMQTDDETWQAYNGWGGTNLYGGAGPAPTGAAFAISYNRPIITRDGGGQVDGGEAAGPQDSLFGAEYNAIYWMEENGYDVSYIAGLDTATNPSLLLNHKIFMDVGHDEYWTDSQVANVQAAANAGVNLAFMSGNEVFWQTQFAPSIDGSNTADRTLVTYKDSHFEKLVNPTGQGTGSFLAPTNWGGAGMPSNALTGTVFQIDGVTGTPGNGELGAITIPYGETQLRIWRNTSVALTAPGKTATLASDLLGYEWDSSPDNGFMPTGLVNLSSTTVTSSQAFNTAFGNVDTSGTATHNLVEYRDPTSGALVFGAGTVMWSWGLADQGDSTSFGNPLPPDPNVQQAMVNLFADMGVQPQTLQSSLAIATASTDHTPPTSTISNVSSTSPVEGQSVTVTGTATDTGGGVIAAVIVSTDGGQTWHPASSAVGAVTENWSYTFNAPAPGTYTIQSRAEDDSLNLQTVATGVSYKVSPSTALSLFSPSATPAAADITDPNGVEVGFKFTASTNGQITGIRFYKGPLNTGVHLVDLWSATGTLLATATSTGETASGWQQVNFSTPVDVAAGVTYVASYHMTNGGYSDTPYYFDTLQNPTNGALSATASALNGFYEYSSGSVFPSNLSPNGDNYWVDVVFNDLSGRPQANNDSGFTVSENGVLNIPASTLLANDTDPAGLPFSITSVSGAVNGSISYNSQTQTVTFTPNAGYAGAASFNYSIADSSGATATGQVSLNVTYPISAQSLFGTNDTPSVTDSDDSNSTEVGIKFTTSANGEITGIRFYKGVGNTGPHVAHLWSSTGTLLATATFTAETASGWQEVDFSTPVFVTAGTTYVASYHTNGDYSASPNYFASGSGVTDGELSAPAAGNGLYSYGTGAVLPTNNFKSTNYWVDVVFDGSNKPIANADSGYVVNENGSISIAASALLANDSDSGNFPFSLTGVSNPQNGTVSYNTNTQTVTFVPTANYNGMASFTYTIGDTNGGTSSAVVSVLVNNPAAETLFSLASSPTTVTVNDPLPVELGVKFTADADGLITGLRFYKGLQNTGPHVADLWSSDGTLLATATFTGETASGWQQVNFATPVSITAGATYVASYHTSGNYSADSNYFANPVVSGDLTAPTAGNGVYAYGANDTFPTNNYNSANYWVDIVYTKSPPRPIANNDSGFIINENGSITIPISTLLANDTDPSGLPISFVGVTNPLNGTESYDASAQTVTFVPNANYVGAASFNYTISDANGAATATVGMFVSSPGTESLFSLGSVPATVLVNDPSSVELGVKFTADANGLITGLRFYKGTQNTGPHVADLWSSDGTLLATATFTNETAVGWQQVNFATPVSITAGATYVASYHTNGDYSADSNYFTNSLVSGDLTAPSAGNGVFAYGTGSIFPNNNFGASNYWVDVVYTKTLSPPVANNDSGLVASENGSVTIAASTLLANDTDPNGLALSVTGVSNASNGTATYDPNSQSVTFTPTAGYTGTASFTYSVADASGATASASASLLVNDPTTASLFNPATAPSIAAANDPSAIEVGVKFTTAESGDITGLRFYKGPGNTGTHVADLWSSDGTLLASATFTNETAGGWQQVNFSAPVPIAVGATYVASYHTNSGDYSADPNLFANPLPNGPLTAPSSASSGGNGVYAYGSSSLFPTNSFNSTSYGVDVVFKPQLAA